MWPSEDASPPPTGREHDLNWVGTIPPMVWIRGIGVALVALAFVIGLLLFPYSTTAWTYETVGFL